MVQFLPGTPKMKRKNKLKQESAVWIFKLGNMQNYVNALRETIKDIDIQIDEIAERIKKTIAT